jgi:ATP-binding cassette subfamily F protein 3
MEAHRAVLAMREELDALHGRLDGITPDDPALSALLERSGELQHHLDLHDEHLLEPEAKRVLSGLGFSIRDQQRPLAEFSGGWRMRAALAALLLTDPTLLFLDEPTNHLDLPAMEWLEDYLADFHGGLVVVSHDRVFLDRVARQIVELDHQALTSFPMSFTAYLDEREVRRERVEAHNEQLEQRIAQLSRFVERFGAKNTKASQAQSKRKMIERLRAERVVLPRRAKGIHFQFPAPPHAGRTLLTLRDASFAYDTDDVFRHARAELSRGEKVAIVGANGAGKTTLLRLLAGQLEPREGTRELSPLTRPSYFAQHAAETLDGQRTALEAVEDIATPEWRPRLRGLLGSFLFSGDDVFKRCRVLSGGERQRVALARILLAPANLLLLDEPTHHLDLAGKEVLEDALDQYPGAVVVVTHDRSLMARIATRVLEVRDARVVLYPGGYEDYEAARLARDAEQAEASRPTEAATAEASKPRAKEKRDGGVTAVAPKAAASRSPAPQAAAIATTRRDDRAAKQKREREIARIEKDITARETRAKALEAELADPELYHDAARSKDRVAEYERLRAELESLWQRLAELG